MFKKQNLSKGVVFGLLVLTNFIAAAHPAMAMPSGPVLGEESVADRPALQSGWLSGWQYRRMVTITNTGGALTDYQVRVALNGSFTWTHANSDGSDLRFTSSDGMTTIPLWIENWIPSTSANIWGKVPSIPANDTQTLYMYYGNAAASSASNGSASFDFFDDFDSSSTTTAPGYYSLGNAQTVLQQSGSESSAPHTLSVVQALNDPSYTYWGYYGLADCGGIWMARSNDLVTWVKDSTPLLSQRERWPSVLRVNGTFYMAYESDYCVGSSHIVYRTSSDGVYFENPQDLVPAENGVVNQNPNLFLDPKTNQFYLYWANNIGIKVKSATTVAGLATAQAQLLLQQLNLLAAPNMLYYNNTYFLALETSDGTTTNWSTWIYASTSPMGPFQLLPDNPILTDGSACPFQHVFETTLHDYYCKNTGGTWTVDYRSANLNAGRQQVQLLAPSRWTPSSASGAWTVRTTTQQDGTNGVVAQGATLASNIAYNSFTGSDYVVEAYSRLMYGRDWGLGFRAANNTVFLYTAVLYAGNGTSNNLYLYRQGGGVLASTNVGPIDRNTWYKVTIKAHGNNFDVYLNDVLRLQGTDPDNLFPSGHIALWGEEATVAQFNNVLVRKYAAVEPTVTVGAEQIPTAVTLSSFSGHAVLGNTQNWVRLEWTTVTEIKTAGFNIYRSERADGPFSRINVRLIPGSGDSLVGGKYEYQDTNVSVGRTYYYQIEDVEFDGTRVPHGPIRVLVASE